MGENGKGYGAMIIYELTPSGGVNRISALPENTRLCCAFGCFDGVHIAHMALLETAARIASEKTEQGLSPAVWTFATPVSKPWIISIPERLALCAKAGIRYALCEEFEEVRGLTPAEFVNGLVKKAGLRHAVCGYNFKFGVDRSGNSEVLEAELMASLRSIGVNGFMDTVTVIGEITALGDAVSSSRVRALLAEGDVETAAVLLGRNYSINGVVCAGQRLGRTISRPTANIRYSKDQLIPKKGVYFSYCKIDGRDYPAVTNIGYRPTVNSDQSDVTCETHVLNFDRSIYDSEVEIIFCRFAREEKRFSDVSELSIQINEDVNQAIRYFESRKETLSD